MAADLALLWDQASGDPVLLYSTAAALLLAVVSLSSGLARRDFRALARPRTLLRVLGAVAIACLLKVLEVYLAPLLPEPVAAATAGLHRLPLYVVALAYGPITGAVVGSLFAGFAASASLPGWPEVVLALELMVLGWLAIYPSPRQTRIAGPLNATLAYLLAWGTAGIALSARANEQVTFAVVYAEHAAMVPGLAVCVVLLFLFGPGTYAKVFPGSRIYPPAPTKERESAPLVTTGSLVPSYASPLEEIDVFGERSGRRDITFSTLALDSSMLPEPLHPPKTTRRQRLEPRLLPDEFSR